MALRIAESRTGVDLHIEINGVLDENGTLPELELVQGRLEIDLSGLKMINSMGCRIWLKWIRNAKALKGTSLVRCSPAFINQLNLMHGFIPEDVKVRSFFVPYMCESCGKEQLLLFKNDISANEPKEIETCPECQSEMS